MKISDWIEDVVTNSAGFYDSPREIAVDIERVGTFLDLKVYLAAKEANMSISSIGARDFPRYLEIGGYMHMLSWLYQPALRNLDTQKGIDAAVEQLQREISKPLKFNEAA